MLNNLSEKKYWKLLFRWFLIFYLFISVVSYFITYAGVGRLEFMSCCYITATNYSGLYAEQMYWVGILLTFFAPFFLIVLLVFSFIVRLDDENYKCFVCTFLMMLFAIIMSSYFIVNGVSGDGRLFKMYASSLIGAYLVNMCIWSALIFPVQWVLFRFVSKISDHGGSK